MSLVLKEIEFQKISLKPGETLVVKLIGDEFLQDAVQLAGFKDSLSRRFTGNSVLVMALPTGTQAEFSAITENKEISSCATGNFCADCNCGKKEQFEGENNGN